MGKTKKLLKLGNKNARPGPLDQQMEKDNLAIPSGRIKIRTIRKDKDDKFVEGQLGKSILKQSIAQINEEMMEESNENPSDEPKTRGSISLGDIGDESSDDEAPVDIDDAAPIPQNVELICTDFEKELGIENGDKLFDNFLNRDFKEQRKLADLFRDKITEKHTDICSQVDATSALPQSQSPQMQELCASLGAVLAKYRSGSLPKVFKMFPQMRCWEELLYMTEPDKWSAAAMYQATRIFISNLNDTMAQRFLNLVLLPRVRDDIDYYHRLNYHLYQALCKALFKPAAFFKGILLPLCQSGNCTLREAIIIGSVIAKNSIPIVHSAAVLLKIAEMNYCGASSIFLRVLFDKKYALPYRVLDSCVYHYIKFRHDRRELPVLWHQSLLAFIQRYKDDLSMDQKDELLEVVKFHGHHKITAEIRREILNSKCRENSTMES